MQTSVDAPPLAFGPRRTSIHQSIEMFEVVDDKSSHCVPFILNHAREKLSDESQQYPIFIGVNGAQGSGKTTLVSLTGRQHVM